MEFSTTIISQRNTKTLGLLENKGCNGDKTVTLHDLQIDFENDTISVHAHVAGVSHRYGLSITFETTNKDGGEHVVLSFVGNTNMN